MRSKPYLTYTIMFMLFCGACYICFFRKGILPIYSIDGIGQYYPSFLYTGKAVREFVSSVFSGGGIRFYDLGIGMGEDLFGVLSYYGFGDPINLIAAFTNASSGPFLFSFSFFLRLYLGGLCFMLYCRRFMPLSFATIVAAISYVFWGYGIFASGMYVQYGAMLYTLPLLLIGCEELFRSGGRPVLFFAAFYLGLCGFYFTYICSIFLIVYCIVRLISIYGIKNVKEALKKVPILTLYYCLGLCCSMMFLLPSLYAFMASERESASILSTLLGLSNYIPSLDRKFVADANIMNALRNYPVMVIAACTFILPKSRKMIQFRVAVATLLVLSYIPMTARLFNGFSNPRDRWVFIAQFVLCVIFASILNDLQSDESRKKIASFIIAAACANIVLSFWGRYSSFGDDKRDMYIGSSAAASETGSVITRSSVITNDGELFRVSGDFSTSSVNERPKNNAMLNGYYGVSYWFSIVNGDTQSFVDEATGIRNDWRAFSLGNSPDKNRAGAVKYHVCKDGMPFEGLKKVETIDEGDSSWTVYEDPSFTGFAHVDDEKGNVISSCKDIRYDKNTFSFTVPEGKGKIATAIPYSSGWRAYINGNITPIVNDSHFISIENTAAGAGDTVTLVYTTPGFIPGSIAAAVAFILFIAGEIFRRRLSQRQG